MASKDILRQNQNFRGKFLAGSSKLGPRMAILRWARNKRRLLKIIAYLGTYSQGEIPRKLGIGPKPYICKGLVSIYGPKVCCLVFSSPKNPLFEPFFRGARKHEITETLGEPNSSTR